MSGCPSGVCASTHGRGAAFTGALLPVWADASAGIITEPTIAASVATYCDLMSLLRVWRARSLLRAFIRRARPRRPDKERPPVRQPQVAAVCAQRAVLRLVPVDNDDGADCQRLLGETAPEHRVRRATFDHPLLDAAIRL